jgi:hypothetical protein
LERLRHLNGTTYRQLIRLAKDIEGKGALYSSLRDSFDLPDAYADVIAENTIQVAQILRKTCQAGTLKFDLNPELYLVTQKVQETQVNCADP